MLKKTVIDPGWRWHDEYPLSQGLRVGNLLFMSGQVPVDATGTTVGPGDLKAQSRQVFENLRAILINAGADLTNIVRLTTYFTVDLEMRGEYLAVRREYFDPPYPASTGVQVVSLAAADWLLEVEAIAIIETDANG